MGLFKRNQIENKGTIVLERADKPVEKRELSGKPHLPTSAASFAKKNISEAKSEAQRIIERANQEAENIRDEAHESGRQEGRAESSSRIEEAMETLNQAVKERKKIVGEAEQEILRLALKVAEQIIRSEVSLHRDVCLNIVSEAIARVSDREQIIVRVNREDAEYLKRYKDRLAGMLDGVKSFSILEDSTIEPGGCVIETNLGFIDSKIATKIKSIEEALNKVSSDNDQES
ncbi:FliH/SctL family protein [Candidatus Margulisiibacteriota bacterium]